MSKLPGDMSKYAVIVVDMWNTHWCKTATLRVNEVAPRMDAFIRQAREFGALIIWAPSDVVDNKEYKDSAPRERARKAKKAVPSHNIATWDPPIWTSTWSGCPDTPSCPSGSVWTHQTDKLYISEGLDAMSDQIEEIWGLIDGRGITNVIYVGVHLNMCILNTRNFSLNSLAGLRGIGSLKEVQFVRDLTDTMYAPSTNPFLNHFATIDIMTHFIEGKYQCSSLLSTDCTGSWNPYTTPFRFRDDSRQVLPDWSNGVQIKCRGEGSTKYLGLNGNDVRLVPFPATWQVLQIGPSLCQLYIPSIGYLNGNPDTGANGLAISKDPYSDSGTRWYVEGPGPDYWLKCCGRYGDSNYLDGNPHDAGILNQKCPINHLGAQWSLIPVAND